jgi:hypothetical protein
MPAERFTKKANTSKRKRQWQHVYESMKSRGEDEESAIRAANAAVKRDFMKHKRSRK